MRPEPHHFDGCTPDDPGVECVEPTARTVPLLLDSPHSGNQYPPALLGALAPERLRRLEDPFVDELFASAPAHGATLVHARFPRAFIDPNRAIDDIDPTVLADPWQGQARPTQKALLGVGLVFTRTPEGDDIYADALTSAEVRGRIEHYYQPYHTLLAERLAALKRRFGFVWHLNCHSMPSHTAGVRATFRKRRPDFCLGNRHGTSCSAELTERVAVHLQRLGYQVSINEPYAGVELLRRHGNPDGGSHSLQIEINRDLYMDELAHRPNAGFPRLAANLDALLGALAAGAEERARAAAE